MTLSAELNKIFVPTPRRVTQPSIIVHIDADGKEWRVFKTTGKVWRSNGCRYDFNRLSDLEYQIKQDGGKMVRRPVQTEAE